MHQVPSRRNDQHAEQRCCDHAAHHRRSDARHHLRAGSSAQEDGKQARHDDRHGHGLGTYAQDGSLADGSNQGFFGVRIALGQSTGVGVLEVDQHHNTELRGNTGESNEAHGGCHGNGMTHHPDEPEATHQ